MPTELVKRVNLDLIYPPLLEDVLEVLAACRKRGADYYAIFGYRSWAEQHQLRQRYLNGTGGRAAPAGYSAHNYGLAFDFARDGDPAKAGLQPVWNAKDYDVLGDEAQKRGLVWGASFNDRPHVQIAKYVSGGQLEPLRKVWNATAGDQAAKLRAVWAYVDAHR